jgi:hypothetical protein
MFTTKTLKEIYQKTDGCCHFCGDEVVFEKYGLKDVHDTIGVWEADHIKQKGKGGLKKAENCLPACYRCNRLRWHRSGDEIRALLFLGLIAKEQIKKKTDLGKKILECSDQRTHSNDLRRRRMK